MSFFINKGKYLILGDDAKENWNSIAQFSVKDADAFIKYEEFLGIKIISYLIVSECFLPSFQFYFVYLIH